MKQTTGDHLPVGDRSRLMGRVRQRDTAPERALGSAMWARGLRDRKSRKVHGTRPDFSFAAKHIAVFVDGCFWHGRPDHYRAPVGNAALGARKLSQNSDRDERDTQVLSNAGWTVLRFWGCQIPTVLTNTVDAIVDAVAGEETCR